MSLNVVSRWRSGAVTGRIAVATVAVGGLVAGGLAAPAGAEPSGVPVDPTQVGKVEVWGTTDPTLLAGPAGLAGKPVQALVAGSSVSLALAEGRVTQWQQPDTTQPTPALPASVNSTPVVQLAAAPTTGNLGVVHADGTVEQWGNFPSGLGEIPSGLTGVTALSMAANSTAALKSDGTVVAWGSGSLSSNDQVVPDGLADVAALSSGVNFHVAVLDDGTLRAWGRDQFGQLAVPAPPEGERFVDAASGTNFTVALTDAGHLALWGRNNPTTNVVATPPAALTGPDAETVVSVDANGDTAAAVTDAGDLYVWGGRAADFLPPESLAGRSVSAVSLSSSHATALVATIQAVGKPTITGTPAVGETLTGVDPTFTQTPDSVTRRWLADGQPIAGETGQTLVLGAAQAGAAITFEVTGTQGIDAAVAVSDPVGPVPGGELVGTGTVTVSGRATVGSTLTGASTFATTPAADSYQRQWLANGAPVAGATGGRYVVRNADLGKRISLRVTAVKSGFESASKDSAATAAVALGAARLKVSAPGKVTQGARLKVTVRGLAAGERVTISLGSKKLGSAKASSNGTATLTAKIAGGQKPGRYAVKAVGSKADRKGATTTKVVKR